MKNQKYTIDCDKDCNTPNPPRGCSFCPDKIVKKFILSALIASANINSIQERLIEELLDRDSTLTPETTGTRSISEQLILDESNIRKIDTIDFNQLLTYAENIVPQLDLPLHYQDIAREQIKILLEEPVDTNIANLSYKTEIALLVLKGISSAARQE